MSARRTIDDAVRDALELHLRELHGAEPHGLHAKLLRVVERPLLDVVMRHAEGNQSRAAHWLGINRNTLRRKLAEHGMLR